MFNEFKISSCGHVYWLGSVVKYVMILLMMSADLGMKINYYVSSIGDNWLVVALDKVFKMTSDWLVTDCFTRNKLTSD